jgi:4'-phosphopantetheinyl transferase
MRVQGSGQLQESIQPFGSSVASFGQACSTAAGDATAGFGPFRQAWTRPSTCGDVQVWFVAAGAHVDLGAQARILDSHDWAAIARIRDVGARELLRAARITLRLALSHAVAGAVQPAAWRFETGSHGKPRVAAGLPEVHFCISHIGTMAVIAVSCDGPIGVDIETLGSACNAGIAETFCTPTERRALARMEEPARRCAFTRLWTLKEAYSKLTGTGLAADFRFLEFGASPELNAIGYQAQHVPGVAQLESWLTEAPGTLCQVSIAVTETETVAQRGALQCFAVAAGGTAAPSRHLNPGRGENAVLTLS